MQKQLFVGNLPRHLTVEELKQHFAPFGEITDIKIPRDRETQFSRGFGFVAFSTEAAAQQAIKAVDGKMIDGRPLRVMPARPLEKIPPREKE